MAASPNLPSDGLAWPCLGIWWARARVQDTLTVSAKIKTQRGDVHPSSAGITLPCRLSVHRHVRCGLPHPAPPGAASRKTGCLWSSFPIGSEDSPTSIGKDSATEMLRNSTKAAQPAQNRGWVRAKGS